MYMYVDNVCVHVDHLPKAAFVNRPNTSNRLNRSMYVNKFPTELSGDVVQSVSNTLTREPSLCPTLFVSSAVNPMSSARPLQSGVRPVLGSIVPISRSRALRMFRILVLRCGMVMTGLSSAI